MLDGIDGIMNLAAASNESLASTSDIVTDAITAFGKTAKDSNHFADVMAAASANANTNVALLGESFKYVAPIAGAFNYSIEDTAIVLGLMANAGVKGSQAGTSLRFAISSLNSPTSNARAAMDKYGISLARSDVQSKTLLELTTDLRKTFGNLGVSAVDSTGALKDYDTIMSEASDSTRLSAEEMEKLSALSTIFGERALPGMLAMINAEEKDFNDLSTAIYGVDGAAKRMADTMMNNLKGSLDLLKSAAEGAILTIMEKGGPSLRRFVDWLVGTMPKIGDTVGNALDFIGTKIGWVSDTIKEITGGADWKFGSIGDKIKLLWNGLVADPLSDWWNGGGREKAIETAGNIGKDLGEILKTGLLTIFGMTDVLSGSGGAAMNAGASIAKSFAEGFAEGFDASLVVEKLKAALGNVTGALGNLWDAMPGWAKALTGGIIGSKVVGGLSQGVLNALVLTKGAKSVLGSASAGTGLLGMGANTAIATGAGNLVHGASLSAGALSAIGLGEIAGGLTIGAGLVHIASSVRESARNTQEGDTVSATANGAEAVSTFAGMGTGAAIGAAVGAHFFGIGAIPGALIGGGIGTAAGWFAGDKIAKNIESARYESEEMQAAIKYADMSAEDLAKTFDKAVYANMKSHFGDMSLSLGEVKRLSEQIVFGDDLPAYNKFTSSVQDAEASLQSLLSAAGQTDRWMWKAGLGVKFDESEISEIQASFNDYIESAKAFVENKHYTFTAAVELLMDPSSASAKGIIESGNAFYSGLQEQLDSLGTKLSDTVKISLGDGIIDIDEQAAISDLQSKIASILDQVANAKQSAHLDLIELKFGGGKLDFGSFDSFMSQMQSTIDERMNASEDAYIEAASGIKLQLDQAEVKFKEGSMPEADFNNIRDSLNQQLNDLNSSYTTKIDNLRAEVMVVELNIIGDAYQDALGKDATSKLSNALESSLKSGIDPIEWTTTDAQKFLNTPNLSEESAGAISKMLSGVASQLKQLDVKGTLKTDFDVETNDSIAEKIQSTVDSQPVDIITTANITAAWEVKNVGDPGREIMALVSPDGQYTVPFDVLADVGWSVGGDKFNPELLSPDGTQRVPISAEAAVKWTAVTGLEFDKYRFTQTIPGVAEPVTVNLPVKTNYTAAEGSSFDASKFTGQIPPVIGPANTQVNVNSTFAPVNKFEFEQGKFGIEDKYPADITTDITARFHPANTFTFNKSAFGIASSYQASTNVAIKVNYTVDKSGMPNISGIKKARGGIIGPRGPMGFAEGGMVRGGPQLVTVAEEGTPEMIIPLGSQRRQRGMQLWRRAGHMLGVEGFANGGIAGSFGRMAEPSDFMPNVIKFPDPETFQPRKVRQNNSEPEPLPRKKTDTGSSEVSVNVGDIHVTLNVNASGNNKEEVMAIVEESIDELVDMFVGKLNQALKNNFANTPALGGETA